MAYTVHDTAAVAARIDHDLETIVDVVREADPGLRSLVLTGGFARGEGAVLHGEPQNDYDLVAVRGLRRALLPYARVRTELERELGLHVDLAPVGAWRLRWVARSIFWYETALRGRVLWGEDLLGRVRVRRAEDLDPAEGLRLLSNRAAGLLLATATPDPEAHRVQAAKALLAAADAHLLAIGAFEPSQIERWLRFKALRAQGALPPGLARYAPWTAWAFAYKTRPDTAPARDAPTAWRIAAQAVLDAVPTAVAHAGLPSLDAYARRDGLVDLVLWLHRARGVPGARTLALHPTGRVRVAALRLLAASLDGRVEREDARRCLAGLASVVDEPLRLLDGLRRATRP